MRHLTEEQLLTRLAKAQRMMGSPNPTDAMRKEAAVEFAALQAEERRRYSFSGWVSGVVSSVLRELHMPSANRATPTAYFWLTSPGPVNLEIIGNIYVKGDARGSAHSIYTEGMGSDFGATVICDNICITDIDDDFAPRSRTSRPWSC